MHHLHIEFPHIEPRDILAVEVYHVRMGDTALAGGVKHCEILAPWRGSQSDQAVVVAVVLLDDRVGEVQRKAPGP